MSLKERDHFIKIYRNKMKTSIDPPEREREKDGEIERWRERKRERG